MPLGELSNDKQCNSCVGDELPDFERTKADILQTALVAVNFSMARQVALLAADPSLALAQMRLTALQMIEDSGVLDFPADEVARQLVHMVFLG